MADVTRPVLIIGGFDYGAWIKEDGVHWSRHDLDAKGSGRSSMDGTLFRNRVRIVNKLTYDFMDLTQEQSEQILTAIEPETFDVQYISPSRGLTETTVYSNDVSADMHTISKDGQILWRGLRFPIIER